MDCKATLEREGEASGRSAGTGSECHGDGDFRSIRKRCDWSCKERLLHRQHRSEPEQHVDWGSAWGDRDIWAPSDALRGPEPGRREPGVSLSVRVPRFCPPDCNLYRPDETLSAR